MTKKSTGSRAQRVSISLKVNLKLENREEFEERFAQNISRSGIFIRAKEPVPVGSRVKFEYRLADKTRIMRGVGIVRWARTKDEAEEPEKPPGMGIEFVDIDADTDELITHMVAKYGEGARAPRKERKREAPKAKSVQPVPKAAAIDDTKLDSEEADALDALMDDWGGGESADTGDAGLDSEEVDAIDAMLGEDVQPAKAAEKEKPAADKPKADKPEADKPKPKRAAKPAAKKDALLDSIDALLGETAAVTGKAAPAKDTTERAPKLDDDASEKEIEVPVDDGEAEGDPLAEIALEVEEQLDALDEIPVEGDTDDLPAAFGDDEGLDLEEIQLDTEQKEASGGGDTVSIDICGAEIVASSGTNRETTQSELIVPRLVIRDGSVQVDEAGVLFPHITSWLSDRWPNPPAIAAARRLGLSLATTEDGDPAIEVEGNPIPLKLAIQAAMAASIRPFRGDAVPQEVHVIVPSSASEASRTAVRDALEQLGVGSVEMTDDVIALIHAAEVNAGPGQSILTIQVGMHETRVAIAEGPATILATTALVDACIAEADRLIFQMATVAFVRQHGVDIEDDPALHDDLAQQTHEGAEGFGDGPWELKIGGVSINLTAEAVAEATIALSERIALACDALMTGQMISSDDLQATLLVSDSNPWPGLLRTLSDMLGVEPRLMEEGGWARIDGLNRG